MIRNLKNKKQLFKVILLSYLTPESRKKPWQKIREVYLPNIMKCTALLCLLLTILTWMGINTGLKEEYQRFKKDPYTTSIFVTSNRGYLNKEQGRKIKKLHYDLKEAEFNTHGKGQKIYDDKVFSFSGLYLVFYAKGGLERKTFRGRTIGSGDKKMLQAIQQQLIKPQNYDLVKDWTDNERGIIVSRYLVERLGYKVGNPTQMKRHIDIRFKNKNYPFKVPLKILAVAQRLPYGDFVVSEEFNYNRLKNTFRPFDTVQRFYVLTPSAKEAELKTFVKKRFKYCKDIININRGKGGIIRYEIVYENFPYYKRQERKQLRHESAKYFIARQFENSGFECQIDYYDWQPLPKNTKNKNPEFLTMYLKEKYIDHLDKLNLFLRESVGGIEMDDTILNIFENYHKDMRRFRKISLVLYAVLVGLGIFVSIAVYIKSVQATMHRLGVLSAFGVSPNFLSIVLAVESVVIFLISILAATFFYFILPPLFIAKEITMELTAANILLLLFIGSLLSFLVVFHTVKSMLKKEPYSLMEYRS